MICIHAGEDIWIAIVQHNGARAGVQWFRKYTDAVKQEIYYSLYYSICIDHDTADG